MKIITHGTICDRSDKPFGYMGWPTVTRLKNDEIIVGVSGLRAAHICPWGKSLIFRSNDEAKTWTDYEIINDTPLDDRDVGLCPLPDGGMLLTWFSSDVRVYDLSTHLDEKLYKDALHYFKYLPKVDTPKELFVANTRRMFPDGSWDIIRNCKVNSPHGPIVNSDGDLIYLGTDWINDGVECMKSSDMGDTWESLSYIPARDGDNVNEYCEPHIIQLEKDVYLAAIRYSNAENFCTLKAYSYDGCKTWTTPEILTEDGTPPHLMRHLSGAIIVSYGNRMDVDGKFGERVVVSYDNGKTFGEPIILSTASNTDLGYPSTIELDDGSLLTVYYQKPEGAKLTALLYTIWSL